MAAQSSNDLVKLGSVPLIGLGVGFVIASLLSVFIVAGTTNSTYQQELANLHADVIAGHLNGRVAEIEQQLSAVSSTVRLSQVLASRDPGMISLEESSLAQTIPDAIRVRLFPLGTARVERNTVPPFSFPSLDLVTRAEAGEPVFPEALESDGRWLMSIARPVRAPASDVINGTVFVYLDLRALSANLPLALRGRASITQTFAGGTETEILAIGANGDASAAPLVRELSPGIWKVSLLPEQSLGSASVLSLTLTVVPAAVLLVIGLLAAIVGLLRLQRLVSADADWLASQVQSAGAGDYRPSTAYALGGFLKAEAALADLGPTNIDPLPVPGDLNLSLEQAAGDKPKARPKPRAEPKPEETPGLIIEDIDEDEFAEYLNLDDDDDDDDEPEVAVDEIDGSVDEVEYEDKAEFPLDNLMEVEGEEAPSEASGTNLLRSVFRACDIRGVINDVLDEDAIYLIGRAIGSEAHARGEQTILVGADGRVSSPAVQEVLIRGLLESGRDVINLGTIPTPLLYYATQNSEAASGVMVTGSHSPAEYNGFKIVLAGESLLDTDIDTLYERVATQDFMSGQGDLTEADVVQDYIDAISDDVVVAQSLKVVVDCANGVGGLVAEDLYTILGCEVVPLYCDVDGDFPNHGRSPLDPENLAELIARVKSEGADLGIALDADADRIVAVTSDGEIVWPDQLLMLFAKDVVSRNPGSDVVYDVKCTRHLSGVISGFGGRPIICRSGHAFIKAKIRETDAVLGGEMSGHICFSERWFGFDDGLYSGARLLEIVGAQSDDLATLIGEFPVSVATPEIHVETSDDEKFGLVERIGALADFGDGTVTTIDGIRVDYEDGWGLVRASNSGPWLSLRFEADDAATLAEIQQVFREQLLAVDETLTLPF